VFGVLQQDIVARRFGLSDDALQQAHDWLRVSGTLWGLDGQHRASFGVPGTTGHTWADGLDRLFLGYALPTQVMAQFPAVDPHRLGECSPGSHWQRFCYFQGEALLRVPYTKFRDQ
jgi:exodeoxyribonuclease V gamma subunit